MLPGLSFPKVRDSSLREIWHESEGFNHYRMKQPCRDCDHKEEDLGGCRCLAYLLPATLTRPTRSARKGRTMKSSVVR